MPKVSTFIIGLILVSAIVAILGIFIAEVGTRYSVEYDENSLEAYNKMAELQSNTQEIKDQTSAIKEKSGQRDVIGGYFSSGFQAMQLTGKSIDTLDSMTNTAVDEADLGASGGILRNAISLMVIVMVIIGILLAAVLKWPV